ncbi:MAG TPA: LuxR C-terminal-related transcriptional regulator, partial [Gemmatimonadaceae bacterium]|nr:LuxR C-terminal-related transcriptional regulator [Gemmatimonadaceae bacterium]
ALDRGEWSAAAVIFTTLVSASPSDALALEGRGLAAWWLDDPDTCFRSRTEAFRLHREAGDDRAAGRVAVWLAWDHDAFRGDYAVASGWLQRARDLLDAHRGSREFAWLSVRDASFALLDNGNPEEALRCAEDAITASRQCGSVDHEMIARALRGFALATSGHVLQGMQELDAVNTAVLAGELRDPLAIGLASCYMIAACDRVREYDRAAQWCARLREFCARWNFRVLFAVCRTQYAAACIWNGAWAEAESELTQASDELQASRPAMIAEALTRLGELRRRQGRLDESQALFDRSGGHPLATVGRATVSLDRGQFDVAAQLAERYLRALKPHNRTERVPALEVLVRASIACLQHEAARVALVDMQSVAREADTPGLHATASLCAGAVAMGSGDADGARRQFEDAVDLFTRCGATFDRARAGIELATSLARLGHDDQAITELHLAIELLTPIDAAHELARATMLRAELSTTPSSAPAPPRAAGVTLTARECDVLRLIADGLGNPAIAARLGISEHTVHRHVANMLVKLGVPSRSAAVASATRLGLL